jgi:hypothetical protein
VIFAQLTHRPQSNGRGSKIEALLFQLGTVSPDDPASYMSMPSSANVQPLLIGLSTVMENAIN